MANLTKHKELDFLKYVTVFLVSLFCASCQTAKWSVISPEATFKQVTWDKTELAGDVAIRTLRQTPEASFHIIRLNKSEKPHIHERHDLVVYVLKEEALVHYRDKTVKVKRGDVIEVPKGTIHWAETVHNKPAEVYAVFTPPFDGKDVKPVTLP